jgi:hypothetical protein
LMIFSATRRLTGERSVNRILRVGAWDVRPLVSD